MFLSTAFSLRHASWKDKCDVHRNISYGFQLLTLITTGQSCGDRSHRALLLMTHQVLCYTEVSPIRKFVSNDRKFRPLERSILYSFDRFNGRNGRNFRSFETNFLIGETSGWIPTAWNQELILLCYFWPWNRKKELILSLLERIDPALSRTNFSLIIIGWRVTRLSFHAPLAGGIKEFVPYFVRPFFDNRKKFRSSIDSESSVRPSGLPCSSVDRRCRRLQRARAGEGACRLRCRRNSANM